ARRPAPAGSHRAAQGRPGRPPPPHALGALGRTAAARGDRARAGHQPGDDAGRRADRRARHGVLGRGAGHLRSPERAGADHHPDHSRAGDRGARPACGEDQRRDDHRRRARLVAGRGAPVIETIRVALGGLSANKLRTGLTILGLMIGVGSVIVLIAVGTGSSAAVTNQIDALGSNVLLVSGAPTLGGLFRRGGGGGATAGTGLTVADASALQSSAQAPDVKSSSPVVNANGVTLTDGSTTYSPSSFVGSTTSYEAARSYTMAEGSWFTNADEQNHSRVLVVGPTVVSELFGGSDPVGQTIQVNGTNFQVIGVTASKGSNGTSNQDDTAIAPLTAVQDTLTGYGNVDQIVVQAKSRGQLN